MSDSFYFTGKVVWCALLEEGIKKRTHLALEVKKLDEAIKELTEIVTIGTEFGVGEDINCDGGITEVSPREQLEKIVKERDLLIQTLTPETEKSFLLELARLAGSLPEKILNACPDGPDKCTYRKLNEQVIPLTLLYTGDSNALLLARVLGKGSMRHASQLPDKDLKILRQWLPYQLEVEYWMMQNLLPDLFKDTITRAKQAVYAFIDKYALEPPSLYPNRVLITLYPPMLAHFLQPTSDRVGGFRPGHETIMAIAKPDRTAATVQTLYGILVHELVHAITYRYLEVYSGEDIADRAFSMPDSVGEALTEILAHFIMTEPLSKKARCEYFRELGPVAYQRYIQSLSKFLSEEKNGVVSIAQFVRAMFSEAQALRLESSLKNRGSSLKQVVDPKTCESTTRAESQKALETLVYALRDPEHGLLTPGDPLIF